MGWLTFNITKDRKHLKCPRCEHLTPNTFDGMLEMRKHERNHQGEQ